MKYESLESIKNEIITQKKRALFALKILPPLLLLSYFSSSFFYPFAFKSFLCLLGFLISSGLFVSGIVLTLAHIPYLPTKRKLEENEKEMQKSLPEYNERKKLEHELMDCIKNNEFFIKQDAEDETKVLFNLKEYCLLFYKNRSVLNIFKLEKNGDLIEKDFSFYSTKMIEDLVGSLLKNKEVSKSNDFVKEVRSILNKSVENESHPSRSNQSNKMNTFKNN